MVRKSKKSEDSEVTEDDGEVKSKKPILIVPLTRKDYPRIEVYTDSTSATAHLKAINDDGKVVSKVSKYCAPTPATIINLADKMILTAKMGRYLKDDYNASLQEFTELLKEHHEFMKSIYLEE